MRGGAKAAPPNALRRAARASTACEPPGTSQWMLSNVALVPRTGPRSHIRPVRRPARSGRRLEVAGVRASSTDCMNSAPQNENACKTRPRCYHCFRIEPATPPIGVVHRRHHPTFHPCVARYVWRQKDSNEYIKYVSDSSFEQDVLKSDTPVLVDYWPNGAARAA